MKNVSVYTSLLLCWLCWCVPVSAQYVWQYVTPEQAVQKVREIVGDNNAPVEVTFAVPPSMRPGIDVSHDLRYGEKTFSVCAYNINQWSWMWWYTDQEFYSDEPISEEMLLRRAIGEEQAIAIARSYMQAHYPAPELLNHVKVKKPIWFGRAPVKYLVEFSQRFPNGVYGPNFFTVLVDVVYGRITSVYCSYYPVLVSTTPVLTPEQAFAAAAQQLQLPNPEAGSLLALAVLRPDPFGWQTLAYGLTVYGSAEGRGQFGYGCLVDAFTGALLWWDELMGGSPAKVRPVRARVDVVGKPLRVEWDGQPVHLNRPAMDFGGQAYLWVGYLVDRGKLGGLRWQAEGRLSLISSSGVLVLHKGSRGYQVNGRRLVASAPVRIVSGRLYVPLDVVKQVLGTEARYDRAQGRVVLGKASAR